MVFYVGEVGRHGGFLKIWELSREITGLRKIQGKISKIGQLKIALTSIVGDLTSIAVRSWPIDYCDVIH